MGEKISDYRNIKRLDPVVTKIVIKSLEIASRLVCGVTGYFFQKRLISRGGQYSRTTQKFIPDEDEEYRIGRI
jgi:hypothetical protein